MTVLEGKNNNTLHHGEGSLQIRLGAMAIASFLVSFFFRQADAVAPGRWNPHLFLTKWANSYLENLTVDLTLFAAISLALMFAGILLAFLLITDWDGFKKRV